MFAFNNVQDGSTCDSGRVLRLLIGLFCIQSKYYCLNHIFSNAFVRFVIFLFRVHISHPYVAVGNTHVRIIRNFILLFCCLSLFLNVSHFLHAVSALSLISFVPPPPAFNRRKHT